MKSLFIALCIVTLGACFQSGMQIQYNCVYGYDSWYAAYVICKKDCGLFSFIFGCDIKEISKRNHLECKGLTCTHEGWYTRADYPLIVRTEHNCTASKSKEVYWTTITDTSKIHEVELSAAKKKSIV